MATEIKRLKNPAGEENYSSPWTRTGVREGEEKESQRGKGEEGTPTRMLPLRLGEVEEQEHNTMPEKTGRIFATWLEITL